MADDRAPDTQSNGDLDPQETLEWLDSFDAAIEKDGPERARFILGKLLERAHAKNVTMPFTATTPYVNTIPKGREPPYPGDRELERRIKSIIRWNAMAMVVRANRDHSGVGGHISTYASAATLLEVGFNHFFQGKGEDWSGDQIYFQGHSAPGIYARAFLEGRLSVDQLENFRRELAEGGGLSSYPHPWLMPDFWEFPTVSMGLAPIMAIYQARLNRYLEDRGLKRTRHEHVWCFMGDGETDEPEALGALSLAGREKLDNLIFVINCNLQRLDGPVRGNGKIIQELEGAFRGAGWHVIKVIWGSDWDPLLDTDDSGLLVRRMEEAVDGDYQKYSVAPGSYTREHFFAKYPEVLKLVENLSDKDIVKLRRGGHDPLKVYAAYKEATERHGKPVCILAKTVKGYGLGEAGEGRNVTHQQKELNEEELRQFRNKFGIPISDEEVGGAPFYRPPDDSPEVQYVRQRRQELGGFVPLRTIREHPFTAPGRDYFEEFLQSSGGREVSTTMAYVRMLSHLLRHPEIGKLIVPIVPDEARTFGMEALFRQFGIYSHVGQLYEPVDSDTLLYYREATDGQIFEEGITEAGSMASFIAAGTAYATHAVNTIPFFIYYSMFGFQRIGDLVWAAADLRCKGFMLGGTAGRTTLSGEGLQHQDGHSHLLAATIPTLRTYDPAYAYETAVIIQDGLRRMYQDEEDGFYYLTLGNENYEMPGMPQGAEEGILRGIHKVRAAKREGKNGHVHLFGSGAILREALRANEILAGRFGVASDVWSVTSYKELRRDALEIDRWNRLHPIAEPRVPYIAQVFAAERPSPIVASSDYMRLVAEQVKPWLPQMTALGTDGFGRSETRVALRRFFEVDAECLAFAAIDRLTEDGKFSAEEVEEARLELGIDAEKADPLAA